MRLWRCLSPRTRLVSPLPALAEQAGFVASSTAIDLLEGRRHRRVTTVPTAAVPLAKDLLERGRI